MPGWAMTRCRRERERGGRRAEALAAWWLRLKGWKILARRLRTPLGEVDLVARRGRTVAFVEVKARASASSSSTPRAPPQWSDRKSVV